MKAMLPLWVEHLEESAPEVHQQVLAVSVATTDRLLAQTRFAGVSNGAACESKLIIGWSLSGVFATHHSAGRIFDA